jgi:hypothetical protein
MRPTKRKKFRLLSLRGANFIWNKAPDIRNTLDGGVPIRSRDATSPQSLYPRPFSPASAVSVSLGSTGDKALACACASSIAAMGIACWRLKMSDTLKPSNTLEKIAVKLGLRPP